MKNRFLLFILSLFLINNAFGQAFRTPTLTGNTGSDFLATEKMATSGGITYSMTWDATNLYLGVGGFGAFIKNEPTLAYFDTDPFLALTDATKNTGSISGYNNYDGRTGSFPFNANVVVYMKANYAEIRTTTTGAWGGSTNITPAVVTGTNDIEITIPWTNFPNGVRPPAMLSTFFKTNGAGGGTDAYGIMPGDAYIGNINTAPFTAANYATTFSTANGAMSNTFAATCMPPKLEANTPLMMNFNDYRGDGFTNTPFLGQLCTNTWATTGLSNGMGLSPKPFGTANTISGHAVGVTTSGVTTGGLYALDRTGGNYAFWIQPSGSNFTATASPGSTLTLKVQNTTGVTLTGVNIMYDMLELNDVGTRSSTFNGSFSTDGTTFTSVAALAHATGLAAVAGITTTAKMADVTGVSIPNNGFFYIRWTSADVAGGSGVRDELGFDNLKISACGITAVAATAPSCTCGNANFAVSFMAFKPNSGSFKVINNATNAVLATGTTSPINVSIPSAAASSIVIRVEDAAMASCKSDPITVALPTCGVSPATVTGSAVASIVGAAAGQYFIIFNSANGGDCGPYNVTINGVTQVYTNAPLAFGPFNHSTNGGPGFYAVSIDDADADLTADATIQVTEAFSTGTASQQNTTFCDCSINTPTALTNGPAGVIMAQSQPGTFQSGGASGQTQVYLAVLAGNIVSVTASGLHKGLANGSYQVYALNYLTADAATLAPLFAVGQPITGLTAPTGAAAAACFNLSAPAPFTIACTSVPAVTNLTRTVCANATTVNLTILESQIGATGGMWTDATGAAVATPAAATVSATTNPFKYKLSGTNTCFNTATVTYSIVANPAAPVAPAAITVCEGASTLISMPSPGAPVTSPASLSWTFPMSSLLGTSSNAAAVNVGAATIGAGLVASGFPGGCPSPTGNVAYSANNWTTAIGDEASALAQNKYFEFPINTLGGNSFDLTSVKFDMQRSTTGPTNYAIYVDGVKAGSTAVYFTASTCNSFTFSGFTRPVGINAASKVRIYAWGGTNASGTFRVDNVTIDGTVKPFAAKAYNFYASNPATPGATLLAGNTGSYNPNTTPATSPQTIWITEINASGCESPAVSVVVTVNPKPTVMLSSSTSPVCSTDKGVINLITTGTPTLTYTWATVGGGGIVAGAQNQTNLNPGTYSVTVTDGNTPACTATMSGLVISVASDVVPPTVVVKNITRTLNAVVFITPADINDGTTDNVTPAGALTLTVTPNSFDCSKIGVNIVTFTATDACGNSASKTATVTILDGTYCNASVATSISDPCSCKNNATTIKNGQFGETVEATGTAGMIFRVKSVTGLYTSAAPAPPTVLGATDLVAVNTLLTLKAGTTNVYTLNGVHVDSLGYSITVERVDGAGMVIPMSEMSIANKCYYPTPIFNINECYNIASPAVVLTATEKNGGAVINTFTVNGVAATSFNPAAGIGSYTIVLTQDASPYTVATGQNPPLTDPGCIQTLTKIVSVVNPTLVCRDKIDISLSNANDCTMPFTAQIALANTAVCGIGSYSATIMNGSNPLGNVVNAGMIGLTLTYKVTAPDGNSCWGTLLVEDKQAPQLTCPAAPIEKFCDETAALAISANVEKTLTSALQTALGVSILEKCAPYSATYSDVVDTKPCSNPLSAVITRNIKAFDNYGNTSMCAVIINIKKRTFADITPATPQIYNNCNVVVNGTVPTTTSGVPTIAGNAIYPSFSSYCGFTVDFNDKKVNTCGNSFDIVRTWKVFDNCSGAYTTQTQTIIVLDKVAPTINNCPAGTLALASNGDKCDVDNYTIKLPTATDDCSGTAPVVTAKVLDASNNVVAVNTVNNVSVGAYTIVYTATDACGNTATCTQAMTIEDKTPPVMVCDLDTKVDLTQDCKAIVNAITFDDGSSDNCCFDVNSLLVARIGGTFATSIQFTQADCAAPVMVQLQGKDCWGNTNVCMVNVIVEDKIAPVAFGRDTTVCCGSGPAATAWLNAYVLPKKPLIDYPNSTNPGWYDNCGATASREQSGSIDNCGNGTITHKWTVTDDKNGTKTNTNVNYISENRSAYTVTFPEDVTLTCTDNKQYASNPSSSGTPNIKTLGATCPLVGVEYTDEVFKVVPDACFKIIRTWKILNWCQPLATNIAGAAGRGDERKTGSACTTQARTYTNISEKRPNGSSVYAAGAPCKSEMDAVKAGESCYNYDNDGYMEYIQIIKVIDVTPPTLTAGSVTFGDGGKECKVAMTINKPSGSDCTGTPTFSYQIVKKSNNAVILSGTSFPTVKEFVQAEFGDYVVRYIANDNCGNFASSDVAVTVADKKKPTPVCYNALSFDLMANGMVMIDAKAFDVGSYDNCGAIAEFGVQVPSPGPDASYDATKVTAQAVFNCKGIQTVALWVKDIYGNWDYCETYVEINNNMNVPNVPICSPNTSPVSAPKINASIKTENGNSASADVTAIVNGQLPGIKKLIQGGNLFIVQKGVDVKILAENDNYPLNGVSTLDLVLISKHILGTQPIMSKYAQMAADVNKSGTISTADIVELRKMILGIQSNFSKNTSWRFFDSNMNEEINFKDIQTDVNANFTAVKIGDVSGNASTTAPRYDQTVYFDIEDKKLKIGEEYKVVLQNNTTEGFQFSLNFDDSALELIDLDKNSTLIENGIINTAQVSGTMEITFRAKQNTVLSKAIQIGNNIRTEVVLEGKGANAALKFNSQTAEMTLFQNRPNPFADATLISFNMSNTENARLVISDISGKVVKTIEKEFAKGYNEVSIGKADLGTTGVFYYRLETATSYLTKKMIVVE